MLGRNWHPVLTGKQIRWGHTDSQSRWDNFGESYCLSNISVFLPLSNMLKWQKELFFLFRLGRPIRYENRRLCIRISAMVTISIIAIVTCLYVISWWWWCILPSTTDYCFADNLTCIWSSTIEGEDKMFKTATWRWYQMSYQRLVDCGNVKKQRIPN